MAEVILFHHVQGVTDGIRAFADALGAAGHVVHTPDLFDGERPSSVEEGVAFVHQVGHQVLDERADRVVTEFPTGVVYAGFSFGSGLAQRFAQTRTGAKGALLYEGCRPLTGEWSFGPWPDGVPVQIHGMDQDPYFALEGDIDAARGIVDAVGPELAELFVYPGDAHLFIDSSLPSYDRDATELVLQRSRQLLDRLGR